MKSLISSFLSASMLLRLLMALIFIHLKLKTRNLYYWSCTEIEKWTHKIWTCPRIGSKVSQCVGFIWWKRASNATSVCSTIILWEYLHEAMKLLYTSIICYPLIYKPYLYSVNYPTVALFYCCSRWSQMPGVDHSHFWWYSLG